MKLIKVQTNGNAGIQCQRYYAAFGVPREVWVELKRGEVVEIPYDSNVSLRGVDFIGDPYEQKDEVVEEKTEEPKKSKKKKE